MTQDENDEIVELLQNPDREIVQLFELNMEYSLSVVVHQDCCAEYLLKRRDMLIPEIVKRAEERNIEPVDVFIEFRQNYHNRSIQEN